MDELWELQQQFMQVQQTKSNPLSDRTLVELLLKLPNFGLVFYQTTDGNEYITQQHLDQLIFQTVLERGRVRVGDLPTLIGINADIIESRLSTVTNRYGLERIDDRVMSKAYLDSLVQILSEKLQTKGSMNIESVAIQFEFPLIYARKFVNERIGDMGADLFNEQIVTKEYNQVKLARLAGCLNGMLRPLLVSQLVKKFDIDERNTTEMIEQLIREKRLNGKLSQGSYIPHQFEINQKAIIESYLVSNQYLEYSMLQKTFCITKPKEWLKNNLAAGRVVYLDEAAINVDALENSKNNVKALLKQEGFAELSKVFPAVFSESDIELLFNQHFGLQSMLISSGYCFDPAWLDRCANEFRDIVIHSLFFKEEPAKGKKKQSKKKVSIDEMTEVLLDSGLIKYIELEEIKDTLYELMLPRLDQLYTKCLGEITQSKGVINSNLLKYRKCKTIVNTLEKCSRMLGTYDKQFKKSEKLWEDPDFGPQEDDKFGLLSMVYFDKIIPKEWPSLDHMVWRSIENMGLQSDSSTFGSIRKGKFMKKSKQCDVLQLIDMFNKEPGTNKIDFSRFLCPQFAQFQKCGVKVVKFIINETEPRYVLVDNLVPILNEELFSSRSDRTVWVSIIEKAYAKLRYCYKGILGVGFSQIFNELTGLQVIRKTSSDWKNAQLREELWGYLQTMVKSQLVAVATEGESEAQIDYDGEPSGFKGNSNYLITSLLDRPSGRLVKIRADITANKVFILSQADQMIIQQQSKGYVFLSEEQLYLLFKNIYIVMNTP